MELTSACPKRCTRPPKASVSTIPCSSAGVIGKAESPCSRFMCCGSIKAPGCIRVIAGLVASLDVAWKYIVIRASLRAHHGAGKPSLYGAGHGGVFGAFKLDHGRLEERLVGKR